MKSIADPAMEEVLAIKEQCWREVELLPIDEAIRESLRKANETADELGFAGAMVLPPASVQKSAA